MDIFLAISIGVYFVMGLFCGIHLMSKDKLTDYTKGDIILAVVFFPYTLTLATTLSIVWLLFITWERLKTTNLIKAVIKWSSTPVYTKET